MIIILAANEKCCDRISEDYEEPTPQGPASYDDHADHFLITIIMMIMLITFFYHNYHDRVALISVLHKKRRKKTDILWSG